jgi:3-oxoacyl-[acyl-carrier-protein] synthase III
LEKRVQTSDRWIVERTGIRERRIAAADETASDLAVRAAVQALGRAGVEPGEVDFIVVGTTTGDASVPTTANLVQHKLGCRSVGSLDLYAACSGSIYALSVGAQFIQTGKHRTVLCVGTEVLSRAVDPSDRGTSVLLGDAAGAVVLLPSEDESGLLDADLYSDGAFAELLFRPPGGTIKMKGPEVFKAAVRKLGDCAARLLDRHGYGMADVDLFVPHQANLRLIEAAVARLGMPLSKVMVNVDRYGNTGAASVYVALEEAWASRRLGHGDLVLLAAFGGGLTWGAALLRW